MCHLYFSIQSFQCGMNNLTVVYCFLSGSKSEDSHLMNFFMLQMQSLRSTLTDIRALTAKIENSTYMSSYCRPVRVADSCQGCLEKHCFVG